MEKDSQNSTAEQPSAVPAAVTVTSVSGGAPTVRTIRPTAGRKSTMSKILIISTIMLKQHTEQLLIANEMLAAKTSETS